MTIIYDTCSIWLIVREKILSSLHLLGFSIHPDFEMKDCVMVGDNYTDLGAARNAGCKSIFCNYGYGVMQDEKADFFIDKFADLKDYIP